MRGLRWFLLSAFVATICWPSVLFGVEPVVFGEWSSNSYRNFVTLNAWVQPNGNDLRVFFNAESAIDRTGSVEVLVPAGDQLVLVSAPVLLPSCDERYDFQTFIWTDTYGITEGLGNTFFSFDCGRPEGICTVPIEPIACGGVASGETTATSLDQIADYSCNGGDYGAGQDVFVFSPAANGRITVTLDELAADLDLMVLRNRFTGCDASQCLYSSTEAGLDAETVTMAVTAGEQYFFAVDGAVGSAGAYRLSLVCDDRLLFADSFEGRSCWSSREPNPLPVRCGVPLLQP
ncbi:MAG: PPC domain-containing protein [Acidobacteriota bacterium]